MDIVDTVGLASFASAEMQVLGARDLGEVDARFGFRLTPVSSGGAETNMLIYTAFCSARLTLRHAVGTVSEAVHLVLRAREVLWSALGICRRWARCSGRDANIVGAWRLQALLARQLTRAAEQRNRFTGQRWIEACSVGLQVFLSVHGHQESGT